MTVPVDEVFGGKAYLPVDGEALQERAVLALRHAAAYGQIDGEHHKTWVIDRMVRCLLGDDYAAFIEQWNDGEEWGWDTGVAP